MCDVRNFDGREKRHQNIPTKYKAIFQSDVFHGIGPSGNKKHYQQNLAKLRSLAKGLTFSRLH